MTDDDARAHAASRRTTSRAPLRELQCLPEQAFHRADTSPDVAHPGRGKPLQQVWRRQPELRHRRLLPLHQRVAEEDPIESMQRADDAPLRSTDDAVEGQEIAAMDQRLAKVPPGKPLRTQVARDHPPLKEVWIGLGPLLPLREEIHAGQRRRGSNRGDPNLHDRGWVAFDRHPADEPTDALDGEAAHPDTKTAQRVLLAPLLLVGVVGPVLLDVATEHVDRVPAVIVGRGRMPVDVQLEIRPLVREPRADRARRRGGRDLRIAGVDGRHSPRHVQSPGRVRAEDPTTIRGGESHRLGRLRRQRLRVQGDEVDRGALALRRQRLRVQRNEVNGDAGRQRLGIECDQVDPHAGRLRLLEASDHRRLRARRPPAAYRLNAPRQAWCGPGHGGSGCRCASIAPVGLAARTSRRRARHCVTGCSRLPAAGTLWQWTPRPP